MDRWLSPGAAVVEFDDFESEIAFLETAFRLFEASIQPPAAVPFGKHFVFRYHEKSKNQLLVQKLASMISGLRAIRQLSIVGYVQEAAVLTRTVDEFSEDILFVALALDRGEWTDQHYRFEVEFWKEEFETAEVLKSRQKRGMVSRTEIRKYIFSGAQETTMSIDSSRRVHKAYSGFVHGASPQIMDMFGGDPPRFHLSGMLGTPRILESMIVSLSYLYRAMTASYWVAHSLENRPVERALVARIEKFGQRFKDYLT